MYYYIAQFNPDTDNSEMLNVSFPDFPGCVTFGKGLEDSMRQAMDALTGYLEVELDGGEELPEPSSLSEAKRKAEEQARELDIPLSEDVLYQLVPADPKVEPCKRFNVSMQPRLLALIDRRAKEIGMTRSGLLAAAAREYVARPLDV